MGEIRVVLIFNEDNERQKEIGRYLKSQKRCKTALITELVYAWLHKENAPVSSYNNANVSVEELKQQLLQDTDFIQQIKKSVVIEEDAGKVIEEEQSDGLDMDERMLMAGLSIFVSDEFLSVVKGLFKCNLSHDVRNILGNVHAALVKIKSFH